MFVCMYMLCFVCSECAWSNWSEICPFPNTTRNYNLVWQHDEVAIGLLQSICEDGLKPELRCDI